MKITIKKLKESNAPDFCFTCGKQLNEGDTMYLLNLGTSGSTFELCRTCLRKISALSNKALNNE